MEKANQATAAPNPAPQAAHFGAMAGDWWDPKGSSAMLHRLNPVRLRYIRDQINRHWQIEGSARRPLAGKRALDMGCGAGLLAEPLARLGADVTGVDAAHENIAAAQRHALGIGLTIDYRTGEAPPSVGAPFDLITCLEVIEHVGDPAGFVAQLAGALAPGGLMIVSTPNRTPLSRLALIGIGETIGGIPRGTHDWDAFLTPDELSGHIAAAGLRVTDTRGLSFNVAKGFVLSDNLQMDYFVTAMA
jgi:2-polyprenyl-6-hydroxyphenyl methylase / 3-demethylubiquinone-9 3-methyltransferase